MSTLKCKDCGFQDVNIKFPTVGVVGDPDDDNWSDPYCPMCRSTHIIQVSEASEMAKYKCDECDHENDVGGACPECMKEFPECSHKLLTMTCTTCNGQASEFGGYYCSNPKLKVYSDLDCPDDDLREKYVECEDCEYWKKCPCQEDEKRE